MLAYFLKSANKRTLTLVLEQPSKHRKTNGLVHQIRTTINLKRDHNSYIDFRLMQRYIGVIKITKSSKFIIFLYLLAICTPFTKMVVAFSRNIHIEQRSKRWKGDLMSFLNISNPIEEHVSRTSRKSSKLTLNLPPLIT